MAEYDPQHEVVDPTAWDEVATSLVIPKQTLGVLQKAHTQDVARYGQFQTVVDEAMVIINNDQRSSRVARELMARSSLLGFSMEGFDDPDVDDATMGERIADSLLFWTSNGPVVIAHDLESEKIQFEAKLKKSGPLLGKVAVRPRYVDLSQPRVVLAGTPMDSGDEPIVTASFVADLVPGRQQVTVLVEDMRDSGFIAEFGHAKHLADQLMDTPPTLG